MAQNTSTAILDEAEALFASRGYDATSLRMITTNAKVNLAAVNYYFGSKEALLEAVYERRIGRLNRERLEMLDALEAKYSGTTIPVKELVEAFVRPALNSSRDDSPGAENFIRLMGRSYLEPSCVLQEKIRKLFEQVTLRFKPAFARALPELPPSDLYWRLHFMVGVLAYCMSGTDMMRMIASSKIEEPNHVDHLVIRLVSFITEGMNSPAVNLENAGAVAQSL